MWMTPSEDDTTLQPQHLLSSLSSKFHASFATRSPPSTLPLRELGMQGSLDCDSVQPRLLPRRAHPPDAPTTGSAVVSQHPASSTSAALPSPIIADPNIPSTALSTPSHSPSPRQTLDRQGSVSSSSLAFSSSCCLSSPSIATLPDPPLPSSSPSLPSPSLPPPDGLLLASEDPVDITLGNLLNVPTNEISSQPSEGNSSNETSMDRRKPPALRSSPSFNSPSYGSIAGSGEPSRAQTPSNTLSADCPPPNVLLTPTSPAPPRPDTAYTSDFLYQPSTNASAASSRHGTLRHKRSQAASLLAQYDSLTGGSNQIPPPGLDAEALLMGLGGSRFDSAGTAATVSAVPSEASYDSDGQDDGLDGLSEGCYDGDNDMQSNFGYPMHNSIASHSSVNGYTYVTGNDNLEANETGLENDGKSFASHHPTGHSRADGGDDPESTDAPSSPADNSPFAQVRASVDTVDNTLLSIGTPRMWFLSTLFSMLGSSTNLFFSLRYPSVAITPVIALLLVHPLGIAWDMILKSPDDPPEEFVDGYLVRNLGHDASYLQRLRLWLSQGQWNEKEHTCVYVSSNVSFGFAFATDVIVEQTMFYKQEASITYQLLLILSTQILGYTFAGLSRRFLVRPSGMIWPSTLMSAAMFATLHKEENKPANGWRISRWKFFYAVFVAAFLFYFIPGLLMPALSYFNVITWFAPKNVVVANLFGVVSGLGLFPLTFDWAQIAYIGSPLLTPFWAAMNVVGGLVVVMWVIAPIAYYSNWLYSSFMPILSASVFDNRGQVYDVSRILTTDFTFDRAAYAEYSRVFLPITYVLSYGVQFAGLASLLTHTACWHGKDIWRQWSQSMEEVKTQKMTAAADTGRISRQTSGAGGVYEPVASHGDGDGDDEAGPHANFSTNVDNPSTVNLAADAVPLQSTSSNNLSDSNMDGLMSHEDVHNRLMGRYKDAPMWWYLVTFISMAAVGMFIVEYYPIHLPWYGLLLALGICAVLFIPIGIIMAVTNQHVSIYLICQLACGAMFPGRPVANMVFVTYGYISSAQGIKFCADLKLGHYMKIPPRILFKVQMVATVVSSVTQIAVLNWMFGNIPGLCTPQALNGFICPIARVHFNGSILWGVVGPGEFFGRNAIYRPLVWCFLVGAVAPIPLWLYSRHRRDSIVRKINLPILLGSLGWIPPATGLNFSVWALVCFLFNHVLKRRATAWWAKYTMTLSAALDAALASGIVVAFFAFIYPGVTANFRWWGTEVYKQGCDWQACAYRTVPEGTTFGPDTW